mgnify:CR=1 FL=1
MYKNILLKLSGESLMNESENINKEKTKEIAELIGTKSVILLYNAYAYRFRKCGSRVKQFLLRILKRGK